ncbi:MAG: TlpA family protein disulfide reductase [Actinomycetes bacterium]
MRRVARRAAGAVGAGLTVLALAGCVASAGATPGGGAPTAPVGNAGGWSPVSCAVAGTGGSSQLPALTLPCLGGKGEVRLDRLAGRAVLVNLWASWCGPCQAETPRLRDALVAARVAGRPVPLVIGVDTNDTATAALAFARRQQVTWPVVSDPRAALATTLGVPGLPVTIGLDAAGRIVYRHIGELTATDARQAIAAVTTSSTEARPLSSIRSPASAPAQPSTTPQPSVSPPARSTS